MEPIKLCDYGCGQEALHYFTKANKHCCPVHYRKCPHQAASAGAKRRGHTHSEDTSKKSRLCRACFNTTQRNLDSHEYWVQQLIEKPGGKVCDFRRE